MDETFVHICFRFVTFYIKQIFQKTFFYITSPNELVSDL